VGGISAFATWGSQALEDNQSILAPSAAMYFSTFDFVDVITYE
jgi:hypothetical protein